MFTVEIESEVTPGEWFPVDGPHSTTIQAADKALWLIRKYKVGGHIRLRLEHGYTAVLGGLDA